MRLSGRDTQKKVGLGLVAGLAVLAYAVGIPAQPQSVGRSAKGTGRVIIASLGGSFEVLHRKTVLEPFERESGINAVVAIYTNISQMKAQVQSGNVEWDTVLLSKAALLSLHEAGLLEKIDYTRMDKADIETLDPRVPIHPYGVPNMVFSSGISYNLKKLSREHHPRSWAEFWDVQKFPGPRSLGAFSGSLTPDLEFALLADGVPVDKLYPLDIDRAFRSLDRIRPHVVKFWTTGAMPAQMLTDGEVIMTSAYMNRIGDLKASGAPVEIEWNQSKLFNNYWVVLKGAKNYENTMRFIAYATRAEVQAALAKATLTGPVNRKAFTFLSPEEARGLPGSPEKLKTQFVYDDEWWAANRAKVQERWLQWILKK